VMGSVGVCGFSLSSVSSVFSFWCRARQPAYALGGWAGLFQDSRAASGRRALPLDGTVGWYFLAQTSDPARTFRCTLHYLNFRFCSRVIFQ